MSNNKKFGVLCVLLAVWVAIFFATLFGERVHPRVMEFMIVICIGWFAYWTVSIIRSKPSVEVSTEVSEPVTQPQPAKKQKANADAKKTPKS